MQEWAVGFGFGGLPLSPELDPLAPGNLQAGSPAQCPYPPHRRHLDLARRFLRCSILKLESRPLKLDGVSYILVIVGFT